MFEPVAPTFTVAARPRPPFPRPPFPRLSVARLANAVAAAVTAAITGAVALAPQPAAALDLSAMRPSVSAFGGITLNNTWDQVFLEPHNLEWQDAGLFGIGLAATVWQPTPSLRFELEGQLVRHVGDQTHWELNAPLVTATWSRFPWSERLASYAAFGIGPSFASQRPRLEAKNNRETSHSLIYWKIELGAELPPEGWSAFWRLHHRSTGYGLMGDAGGANAFTIGLLREF